MRGSNRRSTRRRELFLPATLKFTYEIVELDARTVNVSRQGVSLEALGRIPLLVHVKGNLSRSSRSGGSDGC